MDGPQFRLLLRVPDLTTFNCTSVDSIKISTWAGLPEMLPRLVSICAFESNIDGRGLLSLTRTAATLLAPPISWRRIQRVGWCGMGWIIERWRSACGTWLAKCRLPLAERRGSVRRTFRKVALTLCVRKAARGPTLRVRTPWQIQRHRPLARLTSRRA